MRELLRKFFPEVGGSRKKFPRERMIEIGNRVDRSCVLISMQRNISSGGMHGAGFVVGDTLIVTANHVVSRDAGITVRMIDEESQETKERVVSARVLIRDKENDLAVLEFDGPKVPSLAFSSDDRILPGTELLAMRNAWVNRYSGDKATFLFRSSVDVGGKYTLPDVFKLSGIGQGGDSGSPVVNREGEVVGVLAVTNRAVTDSSPNLLCAVPSSYAERLVHQAHAIQANKRK